MHIARSRGVGGGSFDHDHDDEIGDQGNEDTIPLLSLNKGKQNNDDNDDNDMVSDHRHLLGRAGSRRR
jgi:hypothetical protein